MRIFRQCCALNKKKRRCKTLLRLSDYILEVECYNHNILYYCINHYYRQCFSNIIYITPNLHEIKHKKFLKQLRTHAKLFILKKIAKEELILKSKLDFSIIELILTFI
jgi:hypothetical protein